MKEELLKKQDYFKTSDINLAASLCCGGHQIEAIDKNDPSRAVFFIKKNEYLDEVLQLYFTHQLKVEPLSFANFLKELKTRIYHT